MARTVGVLAIQGGFSSHAAVLSALGATAREVRTAADLDGCDSLVIPGGESTVLTRLLMKPGTGYGTRKPWEPGPLFLSLKEFCRAMPVMGTCAGLIMLARPCGDERVVSLEALDVRVERNAYGRQTESFVAGIPLGLPSNRGNVASRDDREKYPATFIRAPKIVEVGPAVRILARAPNAAGGDDPAMVQFGKVLGLTFHPELTPSDPRIHEYFLSF